MQLSTENRNVLICLIIAVMAYAAGQERNKGQINALRAEIALLQTSIKDRQADTKEMQKPFVVYLPQEENPIVALAEPKTAEKPGNELAWDRAITPLEPFGKAEPLPPYRFIEATPAVLHTVAKKPVTEAMLTPTSFTSGTPPVREQIYGQSAEISKKMPPKVTPRIASKPPVTAPIRTIVGGGRAGSRFHSDGQVYGTLVLISPRNPGF